MKHLIPTFAMAAAMLAGGAQAADKPVRFILVGDSTMASTSGYGDAEHFPTYLRHVPRIDKPFNEKSIGQLIAAGIQPRNV